MESDLYNLPLDCASVNFSYHILSVFILVYEYHH